MLMHHLQEGRPFLIDKLPGGTNQFEKFKDAIRQTEQGMESAERTTDRLADAEDELTGARATDAQIVGPFL